MSYSSACQFQSELAWTDFEPELLEIVSYPFNSTTAKTRLSAASPLYFLHIPKTGGSSLSEVLQRWAGSDCSQSHPLMRGCTGHVSLPRVTQRDLVISLVRHPVSVRTNPVHSVLTVR